MDSKAIETNRQRIIRDFDTYLGNRYQQYQNKLKHPAYKLARLNRAITTKGGLQFRKNDLTMAFRYLDEDSVRFGNGDPFSVSCYSTVSHGFVGIHEADITWLESPTEYRIKGWEDAPLATEADIKAIQNPCKHTRVKIDEMVLPAVEGEWPTGFERQGVCLDCGAPIQLHYITLNAPRKR